MNRLKSLRKEKNIYQKDIAQMLKMSQNGYSQYENEISNIPTKNLKKLARILETNIDYILCLTDDKTIYPYSKIILTENNMNRLKEVREDRDLLQKDIAKILNMSQNGYSQYEIGISDIPIKNLIKLAIFYDISIDYLLYLTDERIPHKRKKEMN